MGPDVVAAIALIYGSGYVTGAVLAPARADDSAAWAVVRTIAGLLLTTIGFLLSLLLSLPWWVGPVCLWAFATTAYGLAGYRLPRPSLRVTRSGVVAFLLAATILAPVVVASARMAQGEFPPVFFNVDNAYFLEKVHALVTTDTYPPPSLSVEGGRFTYHFGTHGLAALVARASGLLPHQALFGVVLPLLACGILAAAFLVARHVAPFVPAWASVTLLLTLVPNFWYSFSLAFVPALWSAVSTVSVAPLEPLLESPELWGIASNTGQNLGGLFLVLAALASIAAAPVRGWTLPVFFIGTAMLVKAPTGLALAAGFGLAQIARAVHARSASPLMPLAAAAALFATVYAAFWVAPGLPVTYRTVPFPFFYLSTVAEQGRLAALWGDLVWLLLPALIVLAFAFRDASRRTLPLALFALAPFVVVNVLRAEDLRPGKGIDFDWLQVLLTVPPLAHAAVLSLASARWDRLTRVARVAFLVVIGLAAVPTVAMAARYSQVVFATPEQGHEFADNRQIGEALRRVPVDGTVVVTNDLRYPAGGFSRANRQLQVPALFGHQAFAVNYAYEAYPFSAERLELQRLLEAEEWSESIRAAAVANGWTHLLVHKQYRHPEPIPLERLFENADYAVYRF